MISYFHKHPCFTYIFLFSKLFIYAHILYFRIKLLSLKKEVINNGLNLLSLLFSLNYFPILIVFNKLIIQGFFLLKKEKQKNILLNMCSLFSFQFF